MKVLNPKYAAGMLAVFLYLLLPVTKTNAQWSEVGGTNTLAANQFIYDICADAKSNIYAGGNFTDSMGKQYVAKWDGKVWTELGGLNGLNANAYVNNVCLDRAGNLYAAGGFTNASGGLYVAKWDGTTWSEVPMQNGFVFNGVLNGLVCDSLGNVYTAGVFQNIDGNDYVAKWNKSTGQWSELGGLDALAANDMIEALCIDKVGNIYAAGNFTNASGKCYVAKWNGKNWTELGGVNALSAHSDIRALYADAAGNIYAGGDFTDANGKEYTAKWDAANNTWSEMGKMDGDLMNGSIGTISGDNLGNIYVGGGAVREITGYDYFVDKWDGTTWTEMGASVIGGSGAVFTTCTDVKGNLYAAGAFLNAQGNSYVALYQPTTTPVKIINFFSILESNSCLLNWRTATELNTSHFIIQHSTNGISFTDIGTVKAIGSGANKYEFTDNKPANGINYYRLQSVDKDGGTSFSKVVSVQFTVNSNQLTVYPNPAKSSVTISGNHIASVQVIDNMGRVVKVVSLKDATNPTLSVSSLPAGVYHLRIQTSDGNVCGASLMVNGK